MNDNRNRQTVVRLNESIWPISPLEPRVAIAEVFTPDLLKAMGEGFDQAWTTIVAAKMACATGHSVNDTRLRIALTIVRAARLGTCDSKRLSAIALRSFLPQMLDGEVGLDRNGSR